MLYVLTVLNEQQQLTSTDIVFLLCICISVFVLFVVCLFSQKKGITLTDDLELFKRK